VNSFHSCLRATLLVTLLGFLSPQLHGQIEVPVATLVRVGIGPIGGPQGNMVTQVLSTDLKRTGMITPVESEAGDYQASGDASGAGLVGKLMNKKTGAAVFTQTFNGTGRAAVHQFADAVTQAVTGVPGFASSKLAFISSSNGAKELYLADIDGASARAITHDGTISSGPSLNRDGTRLTYTSYKSGYPDVYLVDLGTGNRSRIAYFPGINSGPSFSPDGSQIALTLSKDGNPEIYTMPASGGAAPNRITRTRGSETSPSWSPTGDRLVYCSDDRGGPQLFISSSQTISEMDHLVTGNAYCTKPDWSADGKWIAFTTRMSGVFQIGVYDVARRTAQLLTTSGGQDPAWTRDSRHLVYSNNGRLYLLDTLSRQVQPIDMSVAGCSEPTVSR